MWMVCDYVPKYRLEVRLHVALVAVWESRKYSRVFVWQPLSQSGLISKRVILCVLISLAIKQSVTSFYKTQLCAEPSRCKMQLCPPCKTVRSEHFCISYRVRWTCTWLYTIAANTQRPNIPCHSWHVLSSCKDQSVKTCNDASGDDIADPDLIFSGPKQVSVAYWPNSPDVIIRIILDAPFW